LSNIINNFDVFMGLKIILLLLLFLELLPDALSDAIADSIKVPYEK